MKHLILTLLIFFCVPVFSQTSISQLLSISPEQVERYKINTEMNSVVLDMPFASDEIKNPGASILAKGKNIYRIDLVYSKFKQENTFNQPKLNKQRYQNLYAIAPEFFKNSAIEWRAVVQTGCADIEECEGYFHGFVVYYFKPRTTSERRIEATTLKTIVTKEKIGLDTVTKCSKRLTEYYFLPRSKRKREAGIRYARQGLFKRQVVREFDTICRVLVNDKYKYSPAHGFTFGYTPYGYDSVIFRVFDRHPEWNHLNVVADVTGSMSPYLGQLTHWLVLKNNVAKVDQFTFFNDGDNKRVKIAGSTGGIYHTQSKDIDEVLAACSNAMRKGGGGDCPENDVEALIDAMSINSKCKELILIADNYSGMRDLSFYEDLNMPVRIILCGSAGGVNLEYLQLAYKTKGSVHTIEEDLTELYKLNEGESITINGRTFKVKEGEIIYSFSSRT